MIEVTEETGLEKRDGMSIFGTDHLTLDGTGVRDSIRVSGRHIRRALAPRRPGHTAQIIADNSRIGAALPWTARHRDLYEIVTHALLWERQRADFV